MTQRKDLLFAPDGDAGAVLADWWQGLAQDRGGRAELRRARSPDDLVLIPTTIELFTRLRKTPVATHKWWEPRIPPIAGLAAHLAPDAKALILGDPAAGALPKAMARASEGGGRPQVSELRFRRLLRLSRGDLYRPMVRILAQLDGRANLFELAETIFWWGPGTKKSWAFAYFPNLKQSA